MEDRRQRTDPQEWLLGSVDSTDHSSQIEIGRHVCSQCEARAIQGVAEDEHPAPGSYPDGVNVPTGYVTIWQANYLQSDDPDSTLHFWPLPLAERIRDLLDEAIADGKGWITGSDIPPGSEPMFVDSEHSQAKRLARQKAARQYRQGGSA